MALFRFPRRISRTSTLLYISILFATAYLIHEFADSITLPTHWKEDYSHWKDEVTQWAEKQTHHQPKPPTKIFHVPSSPSSDDEKRNAVIEAFKHAWRAYERDAMGSDEYHPISHSGSNISSNGGIGYTVVDALDTMYIMGLQDDYTRARKWVKDKLSFDREGTFSTFETTIRVLGGLLSAYHLTSDSLYLDKAVDLGDRLMAAFDTRSGLPLPSVNFAKKKGVADIYALDRLSTAEAATLQLEFRYLAELTGHEAYWFKAEAVMYIIHNVLKGSEYDNLVPIHMSLDKGDFVLSEIRLGSRGDSYYEYLLKQYLQTSQHEAIYRQMYEESMQGVHNKLVQKSYRHNLTYIAELIRGHQRQWVVSPKQDHLVCFLAGSLMLGATTTGAVSSTVSIPPQMSELTEIGQRDWNTGVELLETCMETHRTETGLSPEIAMFKVDDTTLGKGDSNEDWYIKNSKKGGPRSYDARYMLR
ncbi:glycoside hydrolase [Mucidula mucida]|nr:glycoside hydrolase [Mucidula mucida]